MAHILSDRNRKVRQYSCHVVTLLCVGLLCLLLVGCSNKASDSEQATITVSNATIKQVDLPIDHGKLRGIAKCGGKMLVAAMKNDFPTIYVFDSNGSLIQEVTLDVTDESNNYICGISAESEGFAILYSSRDIEHTEAKVLLSHYDDSYKLSETISLKDAPQQLLGPVITSTGNCILWTPTELIIVDSIGEIKSRQDFSDMELITISNSEDDYFAIAIKASKIGACKIDSDTGELGDFIELGSSSACYTHMTNANNGVLVNTQNHFYKYEIESGELNELFAWTDISKEGNNIDYIISFDTKEFACMSLSEDCVFIVSINSKEVMREIITIGSVGAANSQLEALAYRFNSSSEQYYAKIQYYDTPLQLTTELGAGNAPDVLEMSSVTVPITEKNFVDMTPFISNDLIMGNDYFIDSVIDSMKSDGKLLAIPSSFCVKTVVGRTKDVGENSGWTLDDLKTIISQKDKNCSVFPPWLTSKELMLWICNVSLGQFVDWNKMQCNFIDESIISLLNFCKATPSTFDLGSYTSDYESNILLTIQVIQTPEWIETLKENYGGEKITYIGFPNNDDNNGSFFARSGNDLLLAIPALANHKEAAWEFVSEMLTDSWQEQTTGLPIVRKNLDERLAVLLDEKEPVLTQEDVEDFLSLIEDTELFIHYDATITDIILNESQSFFEGDKTADEVAKIINSRVSLYMGELK